MTVSFLCMAGYNITARHVKVHLAVRMLLKMYNFLQFYQAKKIANLSLVPSNPPPGSTPQKWKVTGICLACVAGAGVKMKRELEGRA